MAAALANLFEHGIEERIFELLGDDGPGHIRETTGHAEPFEIAVVISGHNETPLRTGGAGDFLKIFQLDKLREILGRQPRAPEKINRGAGEMLERFARDLAASLDRQFIAKSRFQIAQRDLKTVPVQDRHEPPDDARQSEAKMARQQRNQPGREQKPNPLQSITNSFPI